MKKQRQPAHYGDDAKAYPEHGVDLMMFEPDPADLGKGGDYRNRGGDIDVTKLESGKKQDDRE